MSDHLPECIYAPRNVDPDKGIEWGGSPCICDALRACEERVLDAAREAVAALKPSNTIDPDALWVWEDALAAIDALTKEDK